MPGFPEQNVEPGMDIVIAHSIISANREKESVAPSALFTFTTAREGFPPEFTISFFKLTILFCGVNPEPVMVILVFTRLAPCAGMDEGEIVLIETVLVS